MVRERLNQRRAARGFTLIELIISMAAGLLISAAAFLLARNASTFFENESRISAAQFATTLGMTRLQDDLRRASFMTSPNVQNDPRLCGSQTGWPAGMSALAGIRITTPAATGLSALNGLSPDRLVLSGAFGTTEQFAVQSLSQGTGGTTTVMLQNDGAMARTLQSVAAGGAALPQIFRVGRFLRIVDLQGRFGFGVITGLDTSGANAIVSVASSPQLPTRNALGTCGCEGFCTGSLVNPVARVRYDLRSIDPTTYPQYAGLNATAGVDPAQVQYHRGMTEPVRTELVRVELDSLDAEIATTLEVIAEYAVDLKFGLTREVPQNPPQTPPVIQRLAIGAADVYTTAPEDIRAVQVRLSTRSAEPDRQTAIVDGGGVYRYRLNNAGTQWARMRTLIADIQLANQSRSLN